MRITGGRFRGFRLHAIPGASIRPTSSITRQAILNMIGDPGGTCGLDLFCGAGTLGLEALSRGAAHVSFIDRSAAALRILRRNVGRLGVEDQVSIQRHDLSRGLPIAGGPAGAYAWAYLDPPYDLAGTPAGVRTLRDLLATLAGPGILRAGGRVFLEHRAGLVLDALEGPLRVAEIRTYGTTGLAILESPEEPEPPSG